MARTLGQIARRFDGGGSAGRTALGEQGREIELAAGQERIRRRRLAAVAAFVAGRHGRDRRAGGRAVGAAEDRNDVEVGPHAQVSVRIELDNGR